MEEDHFDPLFRYRRRVTDDPIRLHILAAHALIEEMLELVIAEAVPNSECFEVSKMQFWKKLDIAAAGCFQEPARQSMTRSWSAIAHRRANGNGSGMR